jgi:hypothetical protein
MKEKTIKNENGEKIHLRINYYLTDIVEIKEEKQIIEKEILIHHEDATDDFMPISKFLCDMIISENELLLIYRTIKELELEEFLTQRI